ncbi:MAG: class I SAM-dependent methyltransferase, partial [Acidimicrobiales bacterium]|nr:class I SAM-dependent methyltransferase [Acidimicrobiales bacterium]
DDYDARWRALEADGRSVHGEADFVAAFDPAAVLDAGCGTGRVAVELARRGCTTVGVDLDPDMLATAARKAPTLPWVAQDLSTLDLTSVAGVPDRFDVVVAAGNVMIFLAPGTEAATVARLAAHLAPGGALVAGFSLHHAPYGLERYDADCAAAGLELAERWSTWERDPWVARGDYAVSVHRAP